MRFESFIAVFLIVGFLISLHCRTEAETISDSHGSESEMSDQKEGDNSLPWEQNRPLGAHKDQHGCYHSDASLYLPVTVSSLWPTYCSRNLIAPNLPSFPIVTFSITHPPRA